jgi:hypothetical protein
VVGVGPCLAGGPRARGAALRAEPRLGRSLSGDRGARAGGRATRGAQRQRAWLPFLRRECGRRTRRGARRFGGQKRARAPDAAAGGRAAELGASGAACPRRDDRRACADARGELLPPRAAGLVVMTGSCAQASRCAAAADRTPGADARTAASGAAGGGRRPSGGRGGAHAAFDLASCRPGGRAETATPVWGGSMLAGGGRHAAAWRGSG